MAGHTLAARSLNLHEGRFNWVFLLWYIVSSVLAILFLFYFNRLFASLVSYGIRAFTWHRYRVYIDVQALQISLLAGRIFFKGLRYHGKNETVIIHDGYITWRYWLRHVQELDCKNPNRVSKASALSNSDSNIVDEGTTNERVEENGGNGTSRQVPCRVLLKSRGVEWFIYNRSPAYDAIFQSMRSQEESDHASAIPSAQRSVRTSEPVSTPKYRSSADSLHKEDARSSIEPKEDKEGQYGEAVTVSDSKSVSTDKSVHYLPSKPSALPSLLHILPVRIECNKGAVVMGNRNTRSILTAKFDSAAGQIDARACGAVDQYKQTFDFDFSHPVIEFKHNEDYTEPQMSEGANVFSGSSAAFEEKTRWFGHVDHRSQFRDIWTSFRDFVPYHRGSVESLTHPRPMTSGAQKPSDDSAGVFGQNRWLGLTRYLDDDDDLIEQERWKAIEYGAFPTIVDSPDISMSIYWDVPGLVPHLESTHNPPPGVETDINGDVPPDWGVELKIRGGTISYGPWADRQRADLQAVFFPALHKDAVPAAKLQPGQPRVSTVLKVVLEIEEQITLRVPTREDSKDWKWKGRTVTSNAADARLKKPKDHAKIKKGMKGSQSPEVRPFGWLDIKVMPDSAVSFTMDLVARSNGYRNQVDLDLKGVEISSSVNHGLLWRSQSQVISCDLSNSLGWNALRRWHVDVNDNGLELFILRDHMFLLIDLINDWTSGPLGEFYTFVPFEYSVGLRFADFKLFLNANDSNIINNPSDVDDNTFVVIWGQKLKADLLIPLKNFRPSRNRMTFDIEATNGGFQLRTPPRTTQHTYLDSSEVASLKKVKVDGSYNYFTTTSPSLTDILLLNVVGVAPRVDLHGFLIRYLMKIKDNYFGDDIHFRTQEEYQSQINISEGQNLEDSASGQHSRLSNDLDVILGIAAEDSCALVPAHLYSSEENVRLEILSIAADLRITNYYMDLAITVSPIALSYTSLAKLCPSDRESYSSTQVFIDGLEVFGHRLFGLPPTEPTYVCNWDFDIGHIRGECSVDFLHCLLMAFRCFSMSFDDAENALPTSNLPAIHDVTFLRAQIRPILIGLRIEQTAFLLSTQDVRVEYNDWAGSQFSDRLCVLVPGLALSVIDVHGVSVDRSLQRPVARTHAYVKLTLELNKFKRKLDFNADRYLQHSHIALHDSRTRRVPWLVLEQDQAGASGPPSRPTKARPPAMTVPSMPEPVSTPVDIMTDESSVLSDTGLPTKPSARKSSFLSAASSRQNRAKRPNSDKRILRPQQKQARSPHYCPQGTGDHPTAKSQVTEEAVSPQEQRDFHTDSSNRLASSSLAFTSPYKQPCFPLLAVQPDTSDVPVPSEHLLSDNLITDSNAANLPKPHISDRGTEHSSVMIGLGQGIQTLCTPKALLVVTQLLARFQTTDTVALLDKLQLDAMTDVSSAEEKRMEGGRVIDVRIFVPLVGARFISTGNNKPSDTKRDECYDVILDSLAVTARSSQSLSNTTPSSLGSQSSFHIVLDSVICSARESSSNKVEDQAIIRISILNPVAWMWHDGSSSAELQFQTLEIESASRKVDYLSSLVQQTLVMSEDFAQRLRTIENERKSRLRLLVLLLTIEGKDIPDPPFLTKASHVLRSSSHHLRTSDSWKMMSRLRYIYHCLPAYSRDKIHAQCIHKLASCPVDAGNRVFESFDHWRTWDLAHVRSSLLMQRVFGHSLASPVRDLQKPVPTKATLRAGAIRILVEPGPSQNEVAIEELIIGVSLYQPNRTPSVSSMVQPLQPSPLTRSTIQVHCAKTAVHLHWALLELVEDLIKTVRGTRSPYRNNSTNLGVTSRPPPQNTCLHLAVSSDVSILTLDTTNLEITSLCQGLRISIVFSKEGADSKISLFSVLVDADAATSEIQRRSSKLTLYKLRRPRVLGSKDVAIDTNAGNLWKIFGAGEDVSFIIVANPLELIEVADSVLGYEVAYINQWKKSLQLASPAQSPVAHQDTAGLIEAHVAFSLDSYLISLTVLPSLTYQIRGEGARTSFRSPLRGSYDSVVDIDLKQHSHLFKSSVNDTSNQLSALHMPSVNVRLGINLKSSKKSVDLNALVESIVFDASAVHAIITTVNRPEMSSLGENISEGASSIQHRYKQIFGMAELGEEKPSLEPILYNAHVTLLSLAVQISTSDSLSISPGAQLQVKMGRIQLRTTNGGLGHGAVMKFPEVEVQLKGIQLKLFRLDNDEALACGDLAIGAVMRSTSKTNDQGELVRAYQIQSSSLQVNIYTDTASVAVAILAHMQDTLKTVDLSHEVQTLRKLGYARLRRNAADLDYVREDQPHSNTGRAALFNSMYSLEMTNIFLAWKLGSSIPISPGRQPEDLILSFAKIDLSTKKDNAARLLIQDFQLQMVPHSISSTVRSQNSALLPEVVFNVAYVSTGADRRLAFQAAGKSLDLRLTSHFILPASDLRHSIALSIQQVRTATSDWSASASTADGQRKALFSDKKLASLLVDADFAGAVVSVQGRSLTDTHLLARNVLGGVRLPQHGRYNQFTPDNANNGSTTLRAPGIAFKVEYRNGGPDDQSLSAEMKIDASSNTLYPTVVPLIMEISSSVKDVVGDSGEKEQATKPSLPQPKFLGDERLRGADPVAILGDCKLNLGLRICRQEFSLSCQPIARVAATARFEDIYITVNTVQSKEHGRFFTVSAAFTRLHASVQHVYSRESTGAFEVDSIVLSLMNSKHVSNANGISVILNISPMKAQVNAKQSQDFLLFREIWVPPEIRRSPSAAAPVPATESQAFIVQRYQHIAAAGAFPWNATVSIAELDVQLDLGQSLGKSAFSITGFWISSKKTSDWEQNLCLGFDKMAINSTGRMSGFVELQNFKVRTSIQWPFIEKAHNQTPLVQASLAFDDLRVKASFDYQAFLIADITTFEFLMYNVRNPQNIGRDRIVGVLDGDKVQVFCTSTSASQAIALYQAFQRLYQEKLAAYETSLRDIEQYLRRKSSINPLAMRAPLTRQEENSAEINRSPLRLQTNVVVTLNAVNIGAFPSTFVDTQILKLEAFDASARFAVVLEDEKIHSTLGMTLGQLRVALASVVRASVPKTLGEVSMVEVVASATNSRGGTILKVPKVVASMETWQMPESTHIDYIFKSSFQGRVDVGWNYSRISYIRGMGTSHARSLAQRLGKPLPQSAVQITGGPQLEGEDESPRLGAGEQGKITAVVHVPQSKYQYRALQPAIIETPQLRDMGEATPPLEWIGLHRERLPNLTHQIVIVTLLEIAKEVEDAYSKILGSS